MADINERMLQLFPTGLKSWEEPILLHIPPSLAANAPVPLRSLEVKVGMAKIMASWMVAIGAVEWLNEAEIKAIEPVLKTFCEIQCSWDGVRDLSAVIFGAIGAKMARSLTQRVDPEQLLGALEALMPAKKAEAPHLSDLELLDLLINHYNETQAADGAKIDHHERRVTKWLHRQNPAGRAMVRQAWPRPYSPDGW